MTNKTYNHGVCKGAIALGTGCMRCERCAEQLAARVQELEAMLEAPPAEQSQLRHSRLHDADALHGKQLSVYGTPKAAPGEQFDSEGFRAWVRKNLPDDTIIGSSLWWANHLTEWAQRFAKAAPQQEAQEPANLPDVEDMAHSAVQEALSYGVNHDLIHRWMRAVMDKTVAALTKPAPAPLSDDVVKDAARWRWLSEHIGVAWDEGKFTSLVRIVSDKNRAALNASIDHMMAGDWIDAALAAQGGK